MREKYFLIIIILISSFFFYNCSEVQDDIVDPPALEGVHPTATLETSSPDFHGRLSEGMGFEPCKNCHDAKLSGGLTSVSCVDCHTSIGVHQEGIFSPESPNFHGKFLADKNLTMSECQECHGVTYSGGISSPSCVNCHDAIAIHKEGILNPSSPDFHGKYLKTTDWALNECKQCHGDDYSGGFISTTCNTCHSEANGPEACNTCHGDFSDPSRIAPPKDLNDNIETTAKGVGAHASHLYNNTMSTSFSCYDCHPQVQSTDNYVFAHINGLPAEVSLDGYDTVDLKCSNTYCHGNFSFSKSDVEQGFEFIHTGTAIVGENFSPKWTQVDGTQAACGTCHLLPPRGHLLEGTDPEAETCASNNCHPSAFNEDGSLNKETHANGEKDF